MLYNRIRRPTTTTTSSTKMVRREKMSYLSTATRRRRHLASTTSLRRNSPKLLNCFSMVCTTVMVMLFSIVDAATVSVDKSCYVLHQDTITIAFDTIVGVGVWIGMYPQESVTNFNALPGFDVPGALTTWILPCGRRDTCDGVGWPSSGTVQMSTSDILEPNRSFVIVVSGDRGALAAQAVTSVFQVVSDSTFCTTTVGTTAPITPASVPISSTTTDGGQAVQSQGTISNLVVVSDAVIPVVNEAREQLASLIRADSDLIGKVRFFNFVSI
jgi:hypothetical protein